MTKMTKFFELRRNIFHIFYGLVYVLLIYFDIFKIKHLVGLFFIGLFVALLSLKIKLPFITWFLRNFERKNTFPGKGALTFLLGVIIAAALFERDIALASIMILTFGDSVSHIIGRYYGEIKHPLNNKKLMEGSICGFICAFIGALFFVSLFKALFASLITMIFEAVELKLGRYVIDDNIIIPLVAGASITFLGYFI